MDNNVMHETKTHGNLSFPYTVYRVMIPEYMDFYPLHWHDEFEIIYVREGNGTIIIQSKQYICTAGDIFIIPPGDIHSISTYEDRHMEYFNIIFKLSLLEENLNSICYQNYFEPLISHEKLVRHYVSPDSDLGKELLPNILFLTYNRKSTDAAYELLIKSNLFTIMHHLYAHALSTSADDISRVNTLNKMKSILTYINKNYSQDISITDAASISSFSESHFMKIFKLLTGKSFTQYLNTYRLEIAARELLQNNKKIIDIAGDVGFHNFSYFIRAFEKKYGVSPSVFRKKD